MTNKSIKRTISTLLSAALLLSAACSALKNHPFILPEELVIEGPQVSFDKNGKGRKLVPNKNML